MAVPSKAFSKVIELNNCKLIKDNLAESIYKQMGGTYKEEEHLKKENAKFKYVKRTINLNTLTAITERKNAETNKIKKSKEWKVYKRDNNKLFAVVEGVFPLSKITKGKELDAYKVTLYEIDLNNLLFKRYTYMGSGKELDTIEKCQSNYAPTISAGLENITSSGSGFFVNKKGNYITNHHVIDGCFQPKILFNEKVINTEIIAKDQTLDLALLKADVRPKQYLALSNDAPEKLQKIFVAGYHFGKGLSDDLKFTNGIISSVKGFADNSNQIQIDAAINPGNSGGPIVGENGELVAVAVSGLSKEKSEGIGFGIKTGSVKNFLDVNKVKYDTGSIFGFSMNNRKLNKLLEDSAVFIFCN